MDTLRNLHMTAGRTGRAAHPAAAWGWTDAVH